VKLTLKVEVGSDTNREAHHVMAEILAGIGTNAMRSLSYSEAVTVIPPPAAPAPFDFNFCSTRPSSGCIDRRGAGYSRVRPDSPATGRAPPGIRLTASAKSAAVQLALKNRRV
jgi:hypothetical protein